MADRENVIKGLEELEGFLFKEYTEIKAEESKIYYDRFKSLSDAIDMLKEQKSVEPKTGHWICGKYDDIFMCSSCEKYSMDDYPYCHWCGAKMKQEGR